MNKDMLEEAKKCCSSGGCGCSTGSICSCTQLSIQNLKDRCISAQIEWGRFMDKKFERKSWLYWFPWVREYIFTANPYLVHGMIEYIEYLEKELEEKNEMLLP